MKHLVESLKYAEEFNYQTAQLKLLSPTYPEVYEMMVGNEYILTSMVEFVYNGVRFKRHHVERVIINPNTRKEWCKERLDHNAKLCIKYAIPIPQDDVIGIETIENNKPN